jgi:hypothetical protein
MFDAHTDSYNKMAQDEYVTCNNHALASVNSDRLLRGLSVHGVSLRFQNHRPIYNVREYNEDFPTLMFFSFSESFVMGDYGLPLHVSIDLDVLKEFPAARMYSQGIHKPQTLRRSLTDVIGNNDIIRLDVGGIGDEEEFTAEAKKRYSEAINLYLTKTDKK